MKVAVMGAGAVGSYLGARLQEAGADAHLIARGEHLAALRERGVTIVTPEGGRSTTPVQATDDVESIGAVDFVLFLVKSYDTEEAARRLQPLIRDDTAVLSLQNGVDNEDRIAAVESPGVVRSNAARLVLGELEPGPPSARVLRFVDLANASGGIEARASKNVVLTKWEKYTLLVAFSAMTAATQLTVGDIRASDAASGMLKAIMAEAWSIGRALGVPLADDHVDKAHALVLAQRDDEGTSLRHDLLTGHRMELEALQGTLRRLGRETGVPTPWTDAAYAVLEPWAIRNEQGHRAG
jgi:2-dehydropantoate 2-reductase